MVCAHLRELYQLCQEHQLRLGGTDLIRVVCRQCGEQEICPSTLMDEYDAIHPTEQTDSEAADSSEEGIR